MALLSKIFKKKKHVGTWYLVDFSNAAKEYAVGHDSCKIIYEMYDKNWTQNSETFTQAKIELLKRQGQVVIDNTQGQEVPQESNFVPRTDIALGTIQIRHVL